MTPQISVIIPVYNSENYVGEAIRSVLDQSIDPDALEILAVDDGSTDGSGAILAEMAAQDARIAVITQKNSGTPGGGRNPAIGLATGEFIFFLDSDDALTPDALRHMAETARAEDSDVVLGRLASMDKRHAPSSMFRRTVMDADLVEDKIFNTLGPTKLIRRTLIEGLGLRFPEDQGSGEDQPFMAAVYLNARKISILADQDYYLIRHRADGSNMTLTRRRTDEHLRTAMRLARTVERYTEPGERRDALLHRPFGWTMRRVLDNRWVRLERTEQQRLQETFRSEIGHLYTEGVRRTLSEEIRWKLDLLVANDLDGLTASIRYFAKKPPRELTWSDGMFQRKMPGELAELLPLDRREAAPPKMSCKLEGVRVGGLVTRISASVKIAELDEAPDSLGIRGHLRHTDTIEDFRVTDEELAPGAPSYVVSAEHGSLGRGVWDLYVVVTFGDYEKELRLGATRARAIEPEGATNLAEDPAPQDRLVAYFTQGPGNLSIDRGGVIDRNTSGARSVGMTLDENGRALMLVETTGTPQRSDEYFCYIEGVRQHGGRQLLPTVRLGTRLIGLRLPMSEQMIGATVNVASVIDGVRTPLAAQGVEYWPARAAGYGFAPDEAGGMKVTGPRETARARSLATWFDLPRPTVDRSPRARAVSVTKAIPVAGPALTRAVRVVRGWRA